MQDKLNSSDCSNYLKALADPERLKIVQCLQGGAKPVGEICKAIGRPLANTSHHLKQLKIGGLVTARKEGRFVYYALAEGVLSRAKGGGKGLDVLDFGCCRLELGKK